MMNFKQQTAPLFIRIKANKFPDTVTVFPE
ncbi:hypothetical protein SAMN05421788_104320 [Filimonas lacunae]|uniref:Uncharacterized protein n=1 Tax=Filimonas lacunae TaxID=477680 RepID=A0A1N7Q2W6_9BACT|nr:hypothetical protein SAMN05421788_104320 [Filimonas lacunae]